MSDTIDTGKRRFLTAAASVVGGAGAVAVAIPFVSSIAPSAKAEAAGAPVQIDISQLE
ncbi:ubiquinol-cytochrome c reductase iron-sulfur subunit, partial [Pseudidiomarina aestuarii]